MPELKEGMKNAAPARLDIDVSRATAPNISVRSDGEGDGPVLEGHFSTFNDWYEINSWFEGHFMERIAPGAFKRTFNAARNSKDKHRIQVLLEHGFDPTVGDKPLGVPTTLEEDSTGARYEVDLFDSGYVNDLLPALRAGVYGSSFRFQVLKDEWDEEPEPSDHNPKGIPERTIKEVRVAEFGPTVFPANPSADAGVRSVTDEYYEKLRTKNKERYEEVVERAARDRGLDSKLLLGSESDEGDEESPNEDSQSEHSDDSRSEELADSPEHSEDPQEDSTPSGEGENRNESCGHAFCEKRSTGENTDWKCYFR